MRLVKFQDLLFHLPDVIRSSRRLVSTILQNSIIYLFDSCQFRASEKIFLFANMADTVKLSKVDSVLSNLGEYQWRPWVQTV